MIPITWRNRRSGVAKLKLKEMGSRYLFICLYVWLEKYFSRGDYRRNRKRKTPMMFGRTEPAVDITATFSDSSIPVLGARRQPDAGLCLGGERLQGKKALHLAPSMRHTFQDDTR